MSDIYIIKLTERQTKKDILAHNKARQANCQNEKAHLSRKYCCANDKMHYQ